MSEQISVAQGITSIVDPLASAGTSLYQTHIKASLNQARLKAGKPICTERPDQPPDCPSIFWKNTTPEELQQVRSYQAPQKQSSALILLVLLISGALVVAMLPKKK